jgi:hypothetical protein
LGRSSWLLAAALSLDAVAACSGTEHSSLDDPPAEEGVDATSSGSGSGGDHGGRGPDGGDDATMRRRDASSGRDPVLDATFVEAADDAREDAADARPADAPGEADLCGPCNALNPTCCTTRGALSYRQCYNSFTCANCCR